MDYRSPIAHLTEEAILKVPRLTQSVISVWVCRMINAGWNLVFEPGVMFVHADEHTARISQENADRLVNLYWKTLRIPDPYNYLRLARPERFRKARNPYQEYEPQVDDE